MEEAAAATGVSPEALARLEMPAVLARLRELCVTTRGQEMAEGLAPVTGLEVVQARQQEVDEACYLCRTHPGFTLRGCHDIRSLLHRAGVGQVLQPAELVTILETILVSRRGHEFWQQLPPDSLPRLRQWFACCGSFLPLERSLAAAVDPQGAILDTASPRLSRLRQQQRGLEEEIRRELNRIISSPQKQKILQENIVTIRQNRYVVPVKAEHQHELPGLLHDQSSSGATVFIEPLTVVHLNNRRRQLQIEEREEIARILAELTRQVAKIAGPLEESLAAMAHLDLALARGQLSLEMEARAPEISSDPVVEIRQGRHPLLGRRAVPIDVTLGRGFDTLVITGPNTGGKTVALKTVGLLVAMAMSGLHVPAVEGTTIGIFDDIFIDIGDEQDITQSLSTFSAHVRYLAGFLPRVGRTSLVLLDEIGVGTDPTQGAALAQALLEYLQDRGAKTVVTTHYDQLKVFAYDHPRVENAAVEFDLATLVPTYRLQVGIPGHSYAFDIAARLGLPAGIVERARSLAGRQTQEMGEIIQDLLLARQAARETAARAEEKEREVTSLKETLAGERSRMREQRERVLAEAREEARRLVRQAEELLSRLRTQVSKGEGAREDFRAEVTNLKEELREPEIQAPGEVPATLVPGQKVFLPRWHQEGTVLSPPDAQDNIQVQMGNLRLNVPRRELRWLKEQARPTPGERSQTKASQTLALAAEKARNLPSQLDVRGLMVAEALEAVDKYLDSAYLAGADRVIVIHGKGTGAIRSALLQHLGSHPQVQAFRLVSDSGATEVKLAP
ncbi:MAG: endonuclease MutS2 [Clostridia bacterium]|nr:MAG: endonuclease MutS2 [Clostridia bacterium]